LIAFDVNTTPASAEKQNPKTNPNRNPNRKKKIRWMTTTINAYTSEVSIDQEIPGSDKQGCHKL